MDDENQKSKAAAEQKAISKREQMSMAIAHITEGLRSMALSPKLAKQALRSIGATGMRVMVGGRPDTSKWTVNQLIEMRKAKGVGRPPGKGCRLQNKNINAQHDVWYRGKFGKWPE